MNISVKNTTFAQTQAPEKFLIGSLFFGVSVLKTKDYQ